jgi:hypothetical protein
MENVFPVAIGVAAVVGAAVYSYSKLNSKKTPVKPQDDITKMERAFDRERAARDAMVGTTDVVLPSRVSAAALLAGEENECSKLIQSLKKHGFAIIQVRSAAFLSLEGN